MEGFAIALERVKANQALSADEFNNLHKDFKVEDAGGNVWTVGIHTRKWHQLAEGNWVPKQPPEAFYIDESVLTSLQSVSKNCGGEQGAVPAGLTAQNATCSQCGASLRPGKKFCTLCGGTAQPAVSGVGGAKVCPQCKQTVAVSKRFCPHCGLRLA